MNSNDTSCGYSLEGTTQALLDALTTTQDQIGWAPSAIQLINAFTEVYNCPNGSASEDLLYKVKEVEKYVTTDLERHIALCLGRAPYYLDRITSHLDSASKLLQDSEDSSVKSIDHLTAELQATCVEYGFCSSLEAIYDTDEASHWLQQLSKKLDMVEGSLGKDDASLALTQLHDVVATLNGVQQAMTPANIAKLQAKFSALQDRITRLENNLSSENIKHDSELFIKYLAGQHLLNKPFVQALHQGDPHDIINDHMIHPGTRGWILERISRWMNKSKTKINFLSGKPGSGKTALASAICKLHNHDVLARHFFDVSHGSSLHNQVSGLVQSIAADLCQVLPEYLNYLDDQLGDGEADGLYKGSWEQNYDILLKGPLQALYGPGRVNQTQSKRKLIIIDGLDESTFSEWTDLKAFLTRFYKDISPNICMFVTVTTEHSGAFSIEDDDNVECLQFENRAWQSRHIKDVEIYLSSSVGAILSGEDERGTPKHAKVDHKTLQNTMDELLKCSAGRFDYAITLMESFAQEMADGGQFLGSVKKAMLPMKQSHGEEIEEKISDFASPYRAYRDKEGRTVDVRVMRQSHYLMDKSRVALIRGRHQIKDLTKSGN